MRLPMEVALMCAAAAMCLPAMGARPTPDELATAKEWVGRHFEPVRSVAAAEAPKAPEPGLTVIANYGPVQRNGRDGNPLRIADKTFASGLYCHAISEILVRLPSPGKTFSAFVGGETNGNYSGGSIRFIVRVGDNELYHSPVLLRGQAGIPVSVDLGGATEFTIAVGEGGDNNNSDQACWGDACVTLADGTQVRLGDMPIAQSALRERTAATPPFSFVYDGKSSDELLGGWKLRATTKKLDDARSQVTQTYTDPKTGLQVRCVIVTYSDFPIVEWTIYYKNTSQQDTPIISDVRSLDTAFKQSGRGEFLLHHFTGSPCAPNDYQPFEAELGPKATKHIATVGGRPTNSDLPYFNLETGRNTGVIAVVSWAGQWAADFVRDDRDGLRICAGQELTRFRLHPGEEVRSPMSVLQFYKGDWIRAQNVWRSWMIAHNIPKLDGKPLHPLASVCTGNHYPGIITNAAEELHFLHRYVEERLKPDFWWQDAGWYQCGDEPDWGKTGTWEVDSRRWPKGIREVSDWCRTQGIRTIVWFEPERVAGGTWLTENHPE
jgi:alpha-galactosidase